MNTQPQSHTDSDLTDGSFKYIWTAVEPLNLTSHQPNITNTTAKHPKFKSDDYLWIYVAPVIFLLGLCGNSLTLVVMRRKRLRGTTTSIYMPAMAIADTIALTSGIVPEWMEACSFPLFSQLSPVACQLEKLVFYSFSDTAIWILVIFTFDRFIAVCFPLKKRLICVPARSKMATVAALLFAVAKNCHVIWTRGTTYDKQGDVLSNCGRPEPYAYFEYFVRPWVAFAVVSALPFCILSFCNLTIISQMIKMRRARLDRSGNEKAFAQTTMMCLSASFAFLLCITPSMVMYIGKAYWTTSNNPHYNVAKTISNLLSYLSHSINFFLYCVTGAKFRRELMLVFCKGRGLRQGVEEISTSHSYLSSNSSAGRYSSAGTPLGQYRLARLSRPDVKAALGSVTTQVIDTVASMKQRRYEETDL